MRLLQVAAIAKPEYDGGLLGYVDASRRQHLPEAYLRLRPLLRDRTLGRAEARQLLDLVTPRSEQLAAVVFDDPRHAGQPAA